MEELINRVIAHVGLDAATARRSIGMMLGFLQTDGPRDKVAALIASMPGAAEPGVMGLGSQLMQSGLGMSEITGVAKETIRYGREKVGAAEIDELVAAIPGLGQFI
jgi:hypothetical protein